MKTYFHIVFHRIFNSAQLSFEAFFNINQYFLQCSAIKLTFLFQCLIIFQKRKSLESPSFTPGVDRDMRPLSFGNLIL